MSKPCRFWLVLVTLATVLAVAAGVSGPARASAGRATAGGGQVIVITARTVGTGQRAVLDLGSMAAGQSRSLPVSIRNETGSEVTVRLDGVAFTGDQSGVLASAATVTLRDGNTVLGSGGAESSRLIGASVLVPAGVTRQLTAGISLPASAGHPGAPGHGLAAEFRFTSVAGAAPVGTGITTGSGPGLPPTAESLTVFHDMVWASLAAFAAALVLGALLALRRPAGAGTAGDDAAEGTGG